MTLVDSSIDFDLTDSNIAALPAELRGRGRDDVRLMIARRGNEEIEHGVFSAMTDHLRPGDALVVNTSGTIPAAVEARTRDDRALRAHFSGESSTGLWWVEIRTPTPGGGTEPGPALDAQSLGLPAGVALQLLTPNPGTPRLWVARLDGVEDVLAYLGAHGRPIRYTPGPELPISSYQTIFAVVPGSAEMPSAARPFTPELVVRLITRGVVVLPITLHSGVSSYEDHETPGPEPFAVPQATAALANELRKNGGRLVAVGTTVARAIETVADENGIIHPGRGSTDLVIHPERGVRVVDGLLSGWHEPRSSHLRLLEAVAGRRLLERAYSAANDAGYLWHEFGDSLLILP